MSDEIEEREKRISILEGEGEELTHQSRNEEKKALIRAYKEKYGRDWKKALNWAKSLKVDRESARDLHGDFSGLRDYNNPRAFRR